MSKLAKFQRSHANYVEKHNRANQLRDIARNCFIRACCHDQIDPDAKFVGFSTGNPHRLTYDAALADLREHLNR